LGISPWFRGQFGASHRDGFRGFDADFDSLALNSEYDDFDILGNPNSLSDLPGQYQHRLILPNFETAVANARPDENGVRRLIRDQSFRSVLTA